MTDQEKKAECHRICGNAGERGMHKIAPEMCPIRLDEWKKPLRRKEY